MSLRMLDSIDNRKEKIHIFQSYVCVEMSVCPEQSLEVILPDAPAFTFEPWTHSSLPYLFALHITKIEHTCTQLNYLVMPPKKRTAAATKPSIGSKAKRRKVTEPAVGGEDAFIDM